MKVKELQKESDAIARGQGRWPKLPKCTEFGGNVIRDEGSNSNFAEPPAPAER